MQMLNTRRRLLGGTIAMLVGAVAACSSDKVNSVQTSIATTVVVDSAANNQTAVAGAALGTPITVTVRDQNGTAMSGVILNWTVTAGGGSVDSATTTTNSSGQSGVHWTLGPASGANSLMVETTNGAGAVINATATDPVPSGYRAATLTAR